MGHGYPGVNLDEVWPVADIRDHAYMLDRGCVMMIWAKSLPRARGLQYSDFSVSWVNKQVNKCKTNILGAKFIDTHRLFSNLFEFIWAYISDTKCVFDQHLLSHLLTKQMLKFPW